MDRGKRCEFDWSNAKELATLLPPVEPLGVKGDGAKKSIHEHSIIDCAASSIAQLSRPAAAFTTTDVAMLAVAARCPHVAVMNREQLIDIDVGFFGAFGRRLISGPRLIHWLVYRA